VKSEQLSDYHRALGCACLAVGCRTRASTKTGLLQLGVLGVVAKVLLDQPKLRSWVLRWMIAVLCAEVCRGCEEAALAVLSGRVAEGLVSRSRDSSPEVRASVVYAIGCVLAAVRHPFAAEAVPSFSLGAWPGPAGGEHQAMAALDGLLAAHSSPPTPAAHDTRWRWLARATMWSYGQETLVESKMPGSVPILDSNFLNEASEIVRHELLCALAPCRGALTESVGSVYASGSSTLGSLPHFRKH
ncbi:unnamed protein product, partial [Polarella glacialis]